VRRVGRAIIAAGQSLQKPYGGRAGAPYSLEEAPALLMSELLRTTLLRRCDARLRSQRAGTAAEVEHSRRFLCARCAPPRTGGRMSRRTEAMQDPVCGQKATIRTFGFDGEV
jgi:hypothetical protein